MSFEDAQGLTWSVVGSQGDRTIDILVLERITAPGVLYLLICTAPTGHLTAAWLNARPGVCRRDDRRLQPHVPQLWALVEHLLGTFWVFDVFGWQ